MKSFSMNKMLGSIKRGPTALLGGGEYLPTWDVCPAAGDAGRRSFPRAARADGDILLVGSSSSDPQGDTPEAAAARGVVRKQL